MKKNKLYYIQFVPNNFGKNKFLVSRLNSNFDCFNVYVSHILRDLSKLNHKYGRDKYFFDINHNCLALLNCFNDIQLILEELNNSKLNNK